MFSQALEQLFASLDDHAIMCLATSQNDAVSARSVSVLRLGRAFYFQSDVRMQKCRQLEANPNVALCCANVQIIGVCQAVGHPSLPENAPVMEQYKRAYEGSFAKYSSLKEEMLYQVTPVSIQVWKYEGEQPYQEFFELPSETYRKEKYAAGD